MTRSYSTNVDSVELIEMMFNVHRSVTHSEVNISTALNYIKHIGEFDIDLSNPHIFLTFYVPEKNGYIAICDNCESENSVTAILLNERGIVEKFLDESYDESFCYIDLSKLENFNLEDKPLLSEMSLFELQKTLNNDYLEVYSFFKSS